jgi:hypothetical protein
VATLTFAVTPPTSAHIQDVQDAAEAATAATPHERLALALEAAADAVREIGGKRGPGRPRKPK